VEDVYAVLAGTYGKDNAVSGEEPQDEEIAADEALIAEPENEAIAAETEAEAAPSTDESAAEEAPSADPAPATEQPGKRSKAWIAWLVAAVLVAAAAAVFCPCVTDAVKAAFSEIASLFE